MGAGASSIMLVEGDELRLRRPSGFRLRSIWVSASAWMRDRGLGRRAEKIVLRGRVTDQRFHGVDPEARDHLGTARVGDGVLGVLGEAAAGSRGVFRTAEPTRRYRRRPLRSGDERHRRAPRERENADGFARVALAVAAGDIRRCTGRGGIVRPSRRRAAASGAVLAVYARTTTPGAGGMRRERVGRRHRHRRSDRGWVRGTIHSTAG
jgi:hypothetical protein